MDGHTQLRVDHMALLTFDVQNDFTLPGAPAEIVGTYSALPATQRLVAAFRERRLPIVHVVRLYRRDGSNVELCRRAQVEAGWRVAAPHSEGAELVAELKPNPSVRLNPDVLFAGEWQQVADREWLMYKPRWGAFYATPLQAHLESLGVDSLLVAGCNFPNCPRTTIYEASERDFRIGLITDATSGLYERAQTELRGIGVNLLNADQAIGFLRVASH